MGKIALLYISWILDRGSFLLWTISCYDYKPVKPFGCHLTYSNFTERAYVPYDVGSKRKS